MDRTLLQRKETLLLEVLLSGLDAKESAREAGSPMLVYLADMLIKRAREDLDGVRLCIVDIPAPAISITPETS